MRKDKVTRKTKETEICVEIKIDGTGKSKINTQIPFLSHMLESFSKWSGFDVDLRAVGDIEVDQHHTIEDIGIVLGKAIRKSLRENRGINRAGYFVMPMDDALSVVAIDLGGRPYLQYNCEFKRRFCGGLDLDCIEDFFYGFSVGAGCNIAVKLLEGRSDHHKIESVFKAFGKAMKMACSKDKKMIEEIPSTKGVIENDSYN
jgi:imidazoleglycerol-phosphate dehydratase